MLSIIRDGLKYMGGIHISPPFMVDPCWGLTETTKFCKAIIFQLKNKFKNFYGRMCIDYMQYHAILCKGLSTCEFWYLWGILEPFPHGYKDMTVMMN